MKPKQRRSNTLGEYATDRFMITLGTNAAYLDPITCLPRKLDNDRLSILFHEYVHYLQNIATAAGYHSYRRALDEWRLFCQTVRPDGTCLGSAGLAPERAKWVAEFLAIGEAFDGHVDLNVPSSFDPDSFDIADVNAIGAAMPLGAATSYVTTVLIQGTARDAGGTTEHYKYHFGAVAVMEGVAYELDQIVARGVSGRRRPKYPSPPFPYQILRALIAHYLPNIDTRSILKLGCLALMSNDPAGALVGLCRIVRDNVKHGATLHAALLGVDATSIHALVDAIIGSDIPDHETAFGGGTLGKGIAYINELFKSYLAERKNEPCLELSIVTADGRVDFDGMRRIFRTIRPCVVLQEAYGRGGKLGRDLLWIGGNEGFGVRDELAVLHCALHFMISHLAQDRIVETAQAWPSACPFYTCCTLPLRKSSPVVCKRRPWRSFNWRKWPNNDRCWYAVAVAASAEPAAAP